MTDVTGSPNILVVDSEILADLCAGIFSVNLSPSIFTYGGALNIRGGYLRIVNPLGVTIKDFTTSGYDFDPNGSPPLSNTVEVAIPTQAGNYQYGTYTFTVAIVDADGTEYTDTKTATICTPDPLNKTKKYGTLGVSIKASCKEGKAYIIVDTPQNYRGEIFESKVNAFILEYPTSSGKAPLHTTLDSFTDQLYEGVWKLTGTECVTYAFDDHVSVAVQYKVKGENDLKCIIDECCVSDNIRALYDVFEGDCSPQEREEAGAKIGEAVALFEIAKLSGNCGEDPSYYISKLEALLGCKCTCQCNEGTPIIPNDPSSDITFSGCGFNETTAGLTKNIEIYNYDYKVDFYPNGNIFSVRSRTLSGCTVTTVLEVNTANLLVALNVRNGLNTTHGAIEVGGDIIRDTNWTLNADYIFTIYDNAKSVILRTVRNTVTIGTINTTLTQFGSGRDDTGTYSPVNFLYTGAGGQLYSSPLTVRNGLSQSNGVFELGGNPLLHDTTIAGAYILNLTQAKLSIGGSTPTDVRVKIINTSTADLTTIQVYNTQPHNNSSSIIGINGLRVLTGTANHTGGQIDAGVAGTLQIAITGSLDLIEGVAYAGVCGVVKAITNLNALVGTFSGLASAIQLQGSPTYFGLAGLHITNPQATSAFTGNITNLYGIKIDAFDAASISGVVPTNVYAIYQAGLTDINYFANKLTFAGTMAGSTGNQTINKPSGQLQIAASGQSVTLNSSYITTSSIVTPSLIATNASDAALSVVVSAQSSGTCTFKLSAAAVGTVKVNFQISEIG